MTTQPNPQEPSLKLNRAVPNMTVYCVEYRSYSTKCVYISMRMCYTYQCNYTRNMLRASKLIMLINYMYKYQAEGDLQHSFHTL